MINHLLELSPFIKREHNSYNSMVHVLCCDWSLDTVSLAPIKNILCNILLDVSPHPPVNLYQIACGIWVN